MKKCEYIHQNNSEINNCQYESKYGNFCCKHKRNYLIDENDLIIRERFTNKISDYLVKDLSNYYHKNIKKEKKKMYKKEYFNEVQKFIQSLERYSDTEKIIRIQRYIRKYLMNKSIQCNNVDDFYTFTPLSEIEPKYFYSYKDNQGLYWGFDIRSLIKLFTMNHLNPYTTENIPELVIKDVKDKFKLLEQTENYEDINEIILKDRKASIKQKVVDLFSDIELSGFSCQIEWFYSLSGRKLKELYKQLEDLWNYRAQLSPEVKRSISPPDGLIFTTPVSEVMHYNCKEDLQELILHNVSTFKNAPNLSDKKLGYMYFIIGLGFVSKECLESHPWLMHI